MVVDIPNTRQRLLDAAVELIDQRGYHGTGLNEIFELSDTSRGSFYHHFPGGKQDLSAAAIQQVGEQLGRHSSRSCKAQRHRPLPSLHSRNYLASSS